MPDLQDDSSTAPSRRKLLAALGLLGGASALGLAGRGTFGPGADSPGNGSGVVVDWSERYNGEVVGVGQLDVGAGTNPLPAGTSTARTTTRPAGGTDDATTVTTTGAAPTTTASTTPSTAADDTTTGVTSDDGGRSTGSNQRSAGGSTGNSQGSAGGTSTTSQESTPTGGNTTTTGGTHSTSTTSTPTGDLLRVSLGGSLSESDVKPGDSGTVYFEVTAGERRVRTWLFGRSVADEENGLTEPERKDPDENGGEPGELGEALEVIVWLDDGDAEPETGGDRSVADGLLELAGLADDETVLAAGSLADVLDRLDGYVPVTERPDAAEPVATCLSPGSTVRVGFAWRLAVDHANELQTDAVVFDLGVRARGCDAPPL